ncbi:MAG: hypothetical protein AABO41_11400 [Acidobacteriota bacterium]
MRDQLFKAHGGRVSDFAFNEDVASVFDDMVARSVPFYSEIQRLVVSMVPQFLHGGIVYDIGSSTGTTIEALVTTLDSGSYSGIVGIEPSAAMRQKAIDKLAEIPGRDCVSFSSEPIENYEILPDANVITILFTMQFVRPLHRGSVLRMCYRSLVSGGCLLLGEKILADDSGLCRLYIDNYHEFKRRAGYSADEISRKREALENVLIPFRDSENRLLLQESGFRIIDQPFRWCNFALYLAVRA